MHAKITLLILGTLLGGSTALAAPKPPVHRLCLNAKGEIVSKVKCTKRETRLNLESLQGPPGQGGTGLSVYDANGSRVGPLISAGEAMINIDGATYLLEFGADGFSSDGPLLLFTGTDCTGTAYLRQQDRNAFYSGLASAFVGGPGRSTLYVLKPPFIEAIDHQSYYSTTGVSGPRCREGTQLPDGTPRSGYELISKGSIQQRFPAPLDVRR